MKKPQPFLQDSFKRNIHYLRISITDRCNLRCIYCMPGEGSPFIPRHALLSTDEIFEVTRVGVRLGIRSIRFTGGEPLVREEVISLVRRIRELSGLQDLSMTTNGVLLKRYARALAQAGLQRINISLDTLDPERFHNITRFGRIEDVFSGIEAALETGLSPIKLNMVVIRGVNDHEILQLARYSLKKPLHVRFIELMPIGEYFEPDRVLPANDILRCLNDFKPLKPVAGPLGCGPARSWAWPGAKGTIGIIGAVSQAFCATCNRLRLTADGHLRPCLDHEGAIDLKPALRPRCDDDQLIQLFQKAVQAKPVSHTMAERETGTLRTCMAGVGG